MTSTERRIGLVLHHYRLEVRDLALTALDWCSRNGIAGTLPPSDADLLERPDLGVSEDIFGDDLTVCLSLGGDGTMLRTTNLVAQQGVAILGVNAGQLGYLTSVDPEDLLAALDEWLRGELAIEARMLLEVELPGSTAALRELALNEVVVDRAESGHTVSVEAYIGGRRFTRYLADGLIVATPTGSTAYSLSAGGPIVEPDFDALVLTPVAAHMVFDRSFVVAPTTEIRLVIGGHHPAMVTVDGRQIAKLSPGDSLLCRAATERAKFVVRGDRDFHKVLKEKFRLEDR